MRNAPTPKFTIRQAQPAEFSALGSLVADVYASLSGMPTGEEQPEYYAMLRDVEKRARNPSICVFAAAGDFGELLGCVDFINDMKQYGSGGTVSQISDAAGIRLLAVRPECRSRESARR